jgi:hypothetical protein
MTNYTKTMGETLESMYISEDNIAILRDIVKRKSAMPLKFADGKMKVDLFTASAVTQALDKVNPANKAKITKLINTGKKANFMSVAKVVMKSENDPEIKEEVEVKVEEVSYLAQQAAILISKRERERNPRKEEVQLDEADFQPHMMYDPKTNKGYKAETMDDHLRMKKMGYVHEKPVSSKEEADLDEAVNKDWQKAVHDLSKKMGASVASGAKGKIIPFVSMNGDTTDVGYTDSKGKKHTIYTTKKSLPRAEKDKMIADIRKKFSEEFSEEVELDEEKIPSHAELVKGKYGDAHAGAQHFSRIGGKEYTWNYLERKGGKYVVTTKKTGEIGLSRAGSKDFKTAKIVKEETDLDEGQLKDMLVQAGDIEYYAKRHGGIDKKDMMKAASLLKKGNKSGALNFVSKLDTSPREKILDLMGEEVELDEGKAEYTKKLMKSRKIVDYVKKQQAKNQKYVAKWGNKKIGVFGNEPRFDSGTMWGQMAGAEVEQSKMSFPDRRSFDAEAEYEAIARKLGLHKFEPRFYKEEVEESYEVGTDEYAKHTREVTPGQEKEIDEARPSARRDAMRDMGKRGKDSADIDDYKATADDRKAASKNIIVQLRKAADLGGTHEVVFKDKKKVKVKPAIAMAFIKKYEKMKPVDKAKLQDKGSKSYKDLLKGLKEEDTSMLGRIERKLKEIRNG